MGMKSASKFTGALVVNLKSQLFKLVKGVLSVAGPTSTQKGGVESQDEKHVLFYCNCFEGEFPLPT
eukprot:1158626-Pelagomonas_calceolata.AAC.2